jgi:hypothetical protein
MFITQLFTPILPQIYSLIAQKDNALSMRDNAALKTISEDQRRIALAATRDSAAMRVISVITAVFLPATFTAVGHNFSIHISQQPLKTQVEQGDPLHFNKYCRNI